MTPIRLDTYVVDTLLPDLVGHDRRPSAFLVYLVLWSRTHGTGRRDTGVSHQALADATGLSKRAVQDAIRVLRRRRLVTTAQTAPTEIIVYSVERPWKNDGKTQDGKAARRQDGK